MPDVPAPQVVLNGETIECGDESNFDSVIKCVELELPHGLLPIDVKYAVAPWATNSLLQFWIIPVSQVGLF
jgi:hypothetical protein